jgi:hypothetical protein
MRMTIIVPDNFVSIDGAFERVDLTKYDLPQVTAIQWYGDQNRGEIEYGGAQRNRKFDSIDIEPFTTIVRDYETVKAERLRKEAEEAEKAATDGESTGN